MPSYDSVVPVQTGGALDLTVPEKEALTKEPNVVTSGGEYSTVTLIREGLLKVIVSWFKFDMHPVSDENFTVTTSNSFIDLL